MESTPESTTGAPPRLINAVTAGFNTVALNIQLILIPVAIDLYLWLGPHLRVRTALKPIVDDWYNEMLNLGTPDMGQLIQTSRVAMQAFLDNFNLFSAVQTIPIGVWNLISPFEEIVSPMGKPLVQDVTSLQGLVLLWIVIALAGLVIGSLYFSLIALVTTEGRIHLSVRRLTWSALQSLALTFLLFLILLAISIPAILILSVLALINTTVAQFVMLAAAFFLLWSLIPLIFSPHGIFAYGQSAVTSLMTSMRLVRSFLPGTGMFVLVLLMLSKGLDLIWQSAPPDSWMMIIGIAGHAFITTAILAASFIYYQGGMRWMQENLQRLAAKRASA